MVSWRPFLPLLFSVPAHCVRRQDGALEGQGGYQHEARDGELKMHFWTWNSAQDTLADAADSLVKAIPGDVDVLVTCQQEGKVPISHEIDAINVEDEYGLHFQWVPVAGGAHWGKANSEVFSGMDAQFMNIFVKSYASNAVSVEDIPVSKPEPVDESYISSIFGTGLRSVVRSVTASSHYADKIIREAATGEEIMRTSSNYVTTSAFGKGGVVASVTYKGALTTQVACMHLDAWHSDNREQGLQQATSALDALGASYHSRFILGDLNYRLLQSEPISETYLDKLYNLIVAHKDPQSVAVFKATDPLNGESVSQAKLISIHGYTCNEPYANYPPTYKLKDPDACLDPNTVEKAAACYSKLPKSDEDRPGELQLGWLDRLCVHYSADNTRVDISQDKAWLLPEFLGSDHRSVSWTVTVTAQ